jgi:hypothetical protein
MSAAGAPRKRSRQKPRFLTAVSGVMSAQIAGSNLRQVMNLRQVINGR